ncbi:MAG: site-2 protease family protein [Candidatus Dadabacteria bacterium]|nr:site-2 protease family protein [Candidatus Dadabacteria bacterium]
MVRRSALIALALLLITATTTFISGYMISGTHAGGILFSLSLIAILGGHEMGHYLYGRKYGVSITLPWFIPAPPFLSPIGTFGAFIRIKSQIRSRKELFDIGVAGPIAGIVVALPVLFVGLLFSDVVALDSERISEMQTAMSLGNSIVFSFFSKMALGPIAEGYEIILHPLAFAGWIGLFVTVLNLMPAGQLDGGHIIYSVFPAEWHRIVSSVTVVSLVIMGVGTAPLLDLADYLGLGVLDTIPEWLVFEGWAGWLFWAILLVVIGTSHPPTLLDDAGIGAGRKALALFSLLVFVSCFTPVPVSIVDFG